MTDEELREDLDVLNVVNFGGGSYVLYAEVQGDEIEVDPEPYSDNFARPARLLPLEAKALVAAIDLLGDHLPEGSLASARQKIVKALGEDPSQEGLQIAPSAADDPDLARTINQAIVDSRLVSIEYYKENEDEFTERTIEPYALINGREGWYVFSFDPEKDDTRHFRLDRIKKAKVTAQDVRAAARGRPERRPRGLAPHRRRAVIARGPRVDRPRPGPLGARAPRRGRGAGRRRARRRAAVRGRALAGARGAEGSRRRGRDRARGRARRPCTTPPGRWPASAGAPRPRPRTASRTRRWWEDGLVRPFWKEDHMRHLSMLRKSLIAAARRAAGDRARLRRLRPRGDEDALGQCRARLHDLAEVQGQEGRPS